MRLQDKVAIVMGGGQTPGETMGNGRAVALTERGDADDIAIRVGRPGADGQFLNDMVDRFLGNILRTAAGGVDDDIGKRSKQFVAVGDIFSKLLLGGIVM